MLASSGLRRLASDAFSDRSYSTPYFSIEPKITFIKGSVYRISLSYNYKESYNSEGLETLQNQTAQAEIRYNVPGNSSVTGRLSYALVDFVGDAETPISFAMLEGLQNGNNALWNVHFDKRLSQVLQLTLAYDGRKTGTANIVHTGSVQMRAVF
jgi:hypothetical protein